MKPINMNDAYELMRFSPLGSWSPDPGQTPAISPEDFARIWTLESGSYTAEQIGLSLPINTFVFVGFKQFGIALCKVGDIAGSSKQCFYTLINAEGYVVDQGVAYFERPAGFVYHDPYERISLAEFAALHGAKPDTIKHHIALGLYPEARKIGRNWSLPVGTPFRANPGTKKDPRT